jgi:hypothetical protein
MLLLAPPALAADRQTQNRDAKKACLTGDYRKGVEILADLFIETNDPIYIFNQGRCLEQSHQWQEAIDRFREYLRKSPALAPRYLTDANKHIADCEGYLEKEKGSLRPPPSPAQTTTPPPEPEPPVPDAKPTVMTTAEPQPTPGAGLKTAGWILVGTGILAVAAGVALNLKANSVANELWDKQSQSKQAQHDRLKTWSWVSYGAGAVFVAAGATFYLWGLKSGRAVTPDSLTFLPVADADGATLNLYGAF